SAACTNSATETITTRRFMLQPPVTCCAMFLRLLYEATALPLVARQARTLGPLKHSTELARDIVEKRHAHQKDEQRYADLRAKGLRPFGQRATLQPFDGLEDNLPAIEY